MENNKNYHSHADYSHGLREAEYMRINASDNLDQEPISLNKALSNLTKKTSIQDEHKPQTDLEDSPHNNKRVSRSNSKKLTSTKGFDEISAYDLQKMKFPEQQYIVDGLFAVSNIVCIASPPKFGKSYMCLDLAISVCNGKDFLGFHTNKCGVLYLDLESSRRRPQARIKQLLPQGVDAPKNLIIGTSARKIGEGFEEDLEQSIQDHPDVKLVIVDIFKRIRPKQGKRNDSYDRDYEDYSSLKYLAVSLNICIILVVHTRQMKDPSDPFNEIIGTNGVIGSIDVAIVLNKKKRDDECAAFHITGRDIESQSYEISFDNSIFRWQMIGNAYELEKKRKQEEYELDPIVNTLKKLIIANNGEWTGSASDIIDESIKLSCPISDAVQQVGTRINKLTPLLKDDDIEVCSNKREKNKRLYTFRINSPFV